MNAGDGGGAAGQQCHNIDTAVLDDKTTPGYSQPAPRATTHTQRPFTPTTGPAFENTYLCVFSRFQKRDLLNPRVKKSLAKV